MPIRLSHISRLGVSVVKNAVTAAAAVIAVLIGGGCDPVPKHVAVVADSMVFYDPAVREPPRSRADYLDAQHITVVYEPRRALDLDRHLAAQGIQRRFAELRQLSGADHTQGEAPFAHPSRFQQAPHTIPPLRQMDGGENPQRELLDFHRRVRFQETHDP